MQNAFDVGRSGLRHVTRAFAVLAALALGPLGAHAASIEELVSSIVRIKTFINPDGQTV